MRVKKIHSNKMAGYLMFVGHRLVNIEDNLNYSGKNIYIFKDCLELRDDMVKYEQFLENNK